MVNRTNELYEVLNPRGVILSKQVSPMSARLEDLKGKTIYYVDVGKPESDVLFDALEQQLPLVSPETRFIRRRKKMSYLTDEHELWEDIEKNADAFIIGAFD